jgi:hypothetical protein
MKVLSLNYKALANVCSRPNFCSFRSHQFAADAGVTGHLGENEMTINGGCLCGGVHYEINGQLLNAGNCHCSMCRRQHGAAYSTYAQCDPDDFRWTSGEGLVKIYEALSGGGWYFCSECGSTLAGTENGTITCVTLGTVEGDPGVRPESHEFVGSRALWHKLTDELPQFEEGSPY